MRLLVTFALIAMTAGLALTACGNDDPFARSPEAEDSATVTPIVTVPPQQPGRASPPLEGPPRDRPFRERVNYWELPQFRLPAPENLPHPPPDETGPEFNPPDEPGCPAGWEWLRRPAEGFEMCYPPDWWLDGHGYVSAGQDDRWYAVGLFTGTEDAVTAHVSVYVVSPYALPFTYTRECESPYQVTFAGEPAVICPDFPGESVEAKIIAYHIRKGERDYFVNVVPRVGVPTAVERLGIEVAHTFRLIDTSDQ